MKTGSLLAQRKARKSPGSSSPPHTPSHAPPASDDTQAAAEMAHQRPAPTDSASTPTAWASALNPPKLVQAAAGPVLSTSASMAPSSSLSPQTVPPQNLAPTAGEGAGSHSRQDRSQHPSRCSAPPTVAQPIPIPVTQHTSPKYFTCEACHQVLCGGGQGHWCRMKQCQDAGNLLQPAAFCPNIKPWPMDYLDNIRWDAIFSGPLICDALASQVLLYSSIICELLACVLENLHNARKSFLLFPRMVFVLPCGSRKYNHQVYMNLMMFKAEEWGTLLSHKFQKMGESSPFPQLKERCVTTLA